MSMHEGVGQGDLAEVPVVSAAGAIERALLVNMSRTELLLVRHGQQDHTVGRARPGQTDPPLTELGRAQAQAAGEFLTSDPVSRIYCSGLQRARETASILAASLRPGDEPTVITELREVELFRGLPKGRPLLEILGRARLEQATGEFLRTRSFDAFPETEPSADLRVRALRELTSLVRAHEGERLVVVSHGGFINSFLAEVLGIGEDMFFFPAHASVTRVLYNEGRWALFSANETSHLVDGERSLVTF